jgi:carboxyl-terminal processing protease
MAARTRWLILFVSTPLVLFVAVGGLLGATRPTVPQQGFSDLRVFQDVVSLIMSAYVEQVDVDRFMEGSMRGLVDGLDPSSAYLSPEEVKAVETNEPLPAGETGLVVTRQFYLRVVGVRDDSPAARAGLLTGDYIRAVDGKPTRDMSAFTGTRLLRGAPGSKVALLIIRGNAADPHEIDLVRTVLKPEFVTSRRLDGGEGYVRVASFATGAADAIRAGVESLARAGAPGVVIDLRSTADGPLDEGIAAARPFVKSGPLAILAGRTDQTTIDAKPGDGVITVPVVLLVSNGTAGPAELFAAALSGHDRAELVGEPTAGIAAVQKLVKLPEDHGLWMTHERYMTVDGKDPIHERGLRPTVGVEIPYPGFDEAPPATDEPLARAVAELKKVKKAA